MDRSRYVFLGDIRKRPGFLTLWERQRNRKEVHWLMECFAESLGVFLYVFPGVGSTLGFTLGNVTQQPGLSSILQIGLAYGFGALFALGIAAGTSGGHFHPGVTVAYTVYRGFPVRKAARYIVAQIFGGYVACMLVYYQWRPLINIMIEEMTAAGQADMLFTPHGPPGAFALYQLPGMTLGPIFLNEFVCATFVALVIWAVSDPTNVIIPPVMAIPVIALAYASAIWGFGTPGVSLNTARDMGGRLWALTIWGPQAAGGRYAAIAALTNFPATLFAALLYEVFLADSDRIVTPQALEFGVVSTGNRRLAQDQQHTGAPDENSLEKGSGSPSDSDKGSVEAREIVPEVRK